MAVKAGARRRLQLECETSGPEAISEKRSVRLVLRSINTAVGVWRFDARWKALHSLEKNDDKTMRRRLTGK